MPTSRQARSRRVVTLRSRLVGMRPFAVRPQTERSQYGVTLGVLRRRPLTPRRHWRGIRERHDDTLVWWFPWFAWLACAVATD